MGFVADRRGLRQAFLLPALCGLVLAALLLASLLTAGRRSESRGAMGGLPPHALAPASRGPDESTRQSEPERSNASRSDRPALSS